MRFLARRYDTRALVAATIEGDRLARLEVRDESLAVGRSIPWLAPGLVDVQVNGLKGQEFSSHDLTIDKVAAIVQDHFAFGVTALCPTLTTQSFACLAHGLQTIDAACRQSAEVDRAVLGIHLEGPYFSTDDGPRGAHPLEHCRRPNWEEFQLLQAAAGGRIAILTMSPQFAEAPEFISRIVASGVVVAIGHTGANSAEIAAAVDAGASMSTHLGNGAHRVLRRHPNYIWDQLAEDRLTASLIVDGHHLPPEVVKTMIRAKTPARVLLVSDVSGLAGLPPGRYASGGGDVEILADGRLVIAGQDQLLAGASRPIGTGIVNAMRFAGLDLPTAVGLATSQPRLALGGPAHHLRPGDPADFVLFDLDRWEHGEFTVRATIFGGTGVYGPAPPAFAA